MSLETGYLYDDNILGSPVDEIGSSVFAVIPGVKYNAAIEAQSFFQASYKLNALFYSDRPTEDKLYNHFFNVKYSHTFSPTLILEVSDAYSLIDSPESFLLGLPLQTNQSNDINQFDFSLAAGLSPRTSMLFKYRNFNFAYDDANVAPVLDRNDNLFGLQVGYNWTPEASLVFEYRSQDRAYSAAAGLKNSDSSFFLFGLDWIPSPTFQINGRIGVDERKQETGADDTNPYG